MLTIKKLGLCLGVLFFLSYSGFSQTDPIVIATQHTNLIYKVSDKGTLYQVYFGKKLAHKTDYKHLYSMGREAIVTGGYTTEGEPAFAVTHADDNPSLALVYQSHHSAIKNGVQTTTIELKDPQYPFYITLHFQAFQEADVIAQWAEIKHKEKGNVVLDHFASAFLQMPGTEYYLTHFYGDWANEMRREEIALPEGIYNIESKLGTRTTKLHQPSFMLALDHPAQEESGVVLAGTLAWTGNFKLLFESLKNREKNADMVAVIPGINNYRSHYVLEPKQVFTTPKFIYTLSYAGQGQASRNLHDWAVNYGVYHGDKPKRTILNNWEATYFDFDEQKLVGLIENAEELGVAVFLLDDGWFGNKYPRNYAGAGLGDWEANREKLPHGLSFLADKAEKEGVVFGIWVEPEMINPKSELYEKHPEWVLKLPNRPEDYQRNQLVLDLSNPKVQDYVVKIVDRILKQNDNIGYIKWDCNRYMSNAYSTYLGDKQSNLTIDYTLGLYKVLERLREKHPEVELMWCSGGGGRAEYGGLKYANEFWPSDNTDGLQRIYLHYNYSYFFPMGIQDSHVTTWGNQPFKYKVDVAMAGKLGFDIRVDELNDKEVALAQEAVKNYEALHTLINAGNLYRLIAPYQNNHAAWMLVNDEQTKAVLYAYNFNVLYGDKFSKIKFGGLDPNKFYRLEEINLPEGVKPQLPVNGQVFSGDFLMKVGLNWYLRSSITSSIVVLTVVD